MTLPTYLNRIRRLDGMIRRKSTGPPEELAQKLGISERWLYKFLGELKEEFGCPIIYDPCRQSYVYKKRGKIVVGFESLTKKEKEKINAGFIRKNEPLYLFVQ